MANNTAVFRQKITGKLPANNSKLISAGALQEVLVSSANAIDEIFETFSLSEGLGTYNATSGVATIKETGATFTPISVANKANGQFFIIDVAGTQSVTGTSRSMAVGGMLVSRGTKWDYIPPADTGYSKVLDLTADFDILDSYLGVEVGPLAKNTYINSGTISSCVTLGGSTGITRTLSTPLPKGRIERVDFWAVRVGDIKFQILKHVSGLIYTVQETFTRTATLGLNTFYPNTLIESDTLLAWFGVAGSDSGMIGIKESLGAVYSVFSGSINDGDTRTLTSVVGNYVFGISCVVSKSNVTNVLQILEDKITNYSLVSDLTTCTTASNPGVTRMLPDKISTGRLVGVDFFATSAGIVTYFILSKNIDGTFNVVYSKDLTVAVGFNKMTITDTEVIADNCYFAWHHATSAAVIGRVDQIGSTYYALTGKATGSNIAFTLSSGFGLGVRIYINTGLRILSDLSNLPSRVSDLEVGSKYLARPDNGIVNFQVSVNCAIPDVTNQGVTPQDAATMHLDWGILQLPSNYSRSGKPIRLIIGCHGTGAWIRETTTSQTAGAFWLSQGFALMDMNGIPASFDNVSWNPGAPSYVDNGNRHYGAPFALQSYIKGYEYVVKNYNVAKDGCFVYGVSMGGLSSNMIVQSGAIPVKAQAGFSACVDLFKEAYVDPWNNGTVQRAKIALYFGFTGTAPTFTNTKPATQPEIDYFIANIGKVMGYNPITKNVPGVGLNVSTGIYKTIPSNTTASQPTEALDYDVFSKTHPVPVKFWHNLGDSVVKYRYIKYLVDMIKRGGGLAELRTFSTGAHEAWMYGDSVTVNSIDGGTVSIQASMYECYLWFNRFE